MNKVQEKKRREELKREKVNICLLQEEGWKFFDCSLDTFITRLEEIRDEAKYQGLTNVSIDAEVEEGYYNTQSISVKIDGYRSYTEEEIDREIQSRKELYESQKQKDEKEFERLKKKLGKD